jgi:DNA replication and repair protein RecF
MAPVEAHTPLALERAGTVARIKLTAFRSYEELTLSVDARPVVLTGANGAGKTNLLEALSLFSPGRGLRGARLSDMARRAQREAAPADAWAIALKLRGTDDIHDLGTGQGFDGGERRQARIDGGTASLGAFAAYLRVLWLTPAMDRLFVEGPSGRRRFLDRLVLSFEAEHAAHSARYSQAMRERNVLLRDGVNDPAWLSALESEMAAHGVKLAAFRLAAVRRLAAALAGQETAFPRAALSLCGQIEDLLADGLAPEEVERDFALRLARMRARDAAAGRAVEGPHASDLQVVHKDLGRPADQCSTGEQKALLVGLVLAQARLVAAEAPGLGPVVLLDEIAAHLDATRREALFAAIAAQELQVWLTGTDAGLFAPLGKAAQHFVVAESRVTPRAGSS